MPQILYKVMENQPNPQRDLLILSRTHKTPKVVQLERNICGKGCQKTELVFDLPTCQGDPTKNEDQRPQQQTCGRVLSCDFPEFIRNVISGKQHENILTTLVAMTPLSRSPQFGNYGSGPNSESECSPKPRNFKLFLDPQSVTFKQIMFVFNQSPLYNGGVQSISVRTSQGEVLAQIQGYRLDQLPQEVLDLLSSLADFIAVENLSDKALTDFDSIPQFLRDCQPFAWFETALGDSKLEAPKSDQSMKFGLTSIKIEQYRVIFQPAQGSHETIEQVHSKLVSLKHLQSKFLNALATECPKLKNSSCFYIQSLLLNCLLVGQVDYGKKGIHLYPILHAVATLLVPKCSPQSQNEDLTYKHFPGILKYPKFCVACKKDNKTGFPGPKKGQTKKTKYYCQACTTFFKTQIRLCVLCFKKFHLNLNFYMAKTPGHSNTISLPPPYTNQFQLVGSWKNKDGLSSRDSPSTLDTKSPLQLLTDVVKTMELFRSMMSPQAG